MYYGNVITEDNFFSTLGARGNAEVNTELITLHAVDPDVSSSPIVYSIRNITFFRVSYFKIKIGFSLLKISIFVLSSLNSYHLVIKKCNNLLKFY